MLQSSQSSGYACQSRDYPVLTLSKIAARQWKVCIDISVTYDHIAAEVWYFRYLRV